MQSEAFIRLFDSQVMRTANQWRQAVIQQHSTGERPEFALDAHQLTVKLSKKITSQQYEFLDFPPRPPCPTAPSHAPILPKKTFPLQLKQQNWAAISTITLQTPICTTLTLRQCQRRRASREMGAGIPEKHQDLDQRRREVGGGASRGLLENVLPSSDIIFVQTMHIDIGYLLAFFGFVFNLCSQWNLKFGKHKLSLQSWFCFRWSKSLVT